MPPDSQKHQPTTVETSILNVLVLSHTLTYMQRVNKFFKANDNHYYKVDWQGNVLHINASLCMFNVIALDVFDVIEGSAMEHHAPLTEISEHEFITKAFDPVNEVFTRIRNR